MTTKIVYGTKPYRHQKEALEVSRDKEYFGILLDVGLGKSKVGLDTINYLFSLGKVRGALVVAPKGMYHQWYNPEEPEECQYSLHFPKSLKVRTLPLRWTSEGTKAWRNLRDSLFNKTDRPAFLRYYVMNVEALSTAKGKKEAEAFLRAWPSILIVDESTTIGNRTSTRTRALLRLGRLALYRRIMTAHPALNSPEKLFSQAKFLSPSILGDNFFAFRGRYAKMKKITTSGGRLLDVVDEWKNLDKLSRVISPYVYRKTADECLDLPEQVYLKYEAPLTKEQRVAYNSMAEESILFLSKLEAVTAPLALTRILRLQQITCGFITTQEGEEVEIPSRRIEALMSLLEETSGKVVIWCPFRLPVRRIVEALRNTYGPLSYMEYHGGVPESLRKGGLGWFKNRAECRFFVGTPGTGKFGLNDLRDARTTIYVSNGYDLEQRVQTEGRTRRANSKGSSRVYIDLTAPRTIDDKIRKALINKQDIARTLTGDGWREWIHA